MGLLKQNQDKFYNETEQEETNNLKKRFETVKLDDNYLGASSKTLIEIGIAANNVIKFDK